MNHLELSLFPVYTHHLASRMVYVSPLTVFSLLLFITTTIVFSTPPSFFLGFFHSFLNCLCTFSFAPSPSAQLVSIVISLNFKSDKVSIKSFRGFPYPVFRRQSLNSLTQFMIASSFGVYLILQPYVF